MHTLLVDGDDALRALIEAHPGGLSERHLWVLANGVHGGAVAAGYFGKTLEKQLIDTLGKSLESETDIKMMLVQSAQTPNFDTMDFRDDITNEPGNSGTYAAGGSVITTTELTVASPAATQLKYTSDAVAWTGATLAADGSVGYVGRGGLSSADEVIWESSFGGTVSSVAGTFTETPHANGWLYFDYA